MFLGNGHSDADPKVSTESWYDVKAKFTRYWREVGSKVGEILALGLTIVNNIQKYNSISQRAAPPSVKEAASKGLQRSQAHYTLWSKVKGKINKS